MQHDKITVSASSFRSPLLKVRWDLNILDECALRVKRRIILVSRNGCFADQKKTLFVKTIP